MFEVVALLKKKPDMPREDFIRYYEERHAPLILEVQPNIQSYSRRYVDLTDALIFDGAGSPDFDVITTIRFADRAAYESAMAVFTDPAVAARIAEDEENFLDRSRTRFFHVDTRQS